MTKATITGLALAVALVGITSTAQAVVDQDLLVELVAADNPDGNHNNDEWATTGNSSLSGEYTTAGGVNRPDRTAFSTGTQGTVTAYDAAGVTAGFGSESASGQPNLQMGSFSWELWLRRTGGVKNTEHQIARLRSSTGPNQWFSLFVQWNDTGHVDPQSIDIDMGVNNGATRIKHFDVLILPQRTDTEDFDHLVVTFDNTTGTSNLKLYLNNAAPVTLNANITYDSNDPFDDTTIFHMSVGEAARGFNGQIAVMRVYGDILTAQEIAGNYGHGPQAVPEPATMALLGLGGLMVLRRRRSA